jgi:hypothetical protein
MKSLLKAAYCMTKTHFIQQYAWDIYGRYIIADSFLRVYEANE